MKQLVPIIDCPHCLRKDVPASHYGPFVKQVRDKKGQFVKGGRMEIHIWTCTSCDNVLNLYSDFEPKKWVNLKELESMGWKKEQAQS